MKEEPAIDVREFMQEYFDAWQEGITEKILDYYSDEQQYISVTGTCLSKRWSRVVSQFGVRRQSAAATGAQASSLALFGSRFALIASEDACAPVIELELPPHSKSRHHLEPPRKRALSIPTRNTHLIRNWFA